MTDSAQILIDELDAINSKIDKIKLNADKVEQAARLGSSQGTSAIQNQARSLQESSQQFAVAGRQLTQIIQNELIPAAKEERNGKGWLIAKIIIPLFIAFGLFFAGFFWGSTNTLERQMNFVTMLGQTACEKAGLIWHYNTEARAKICYQQVGD